MVCGSVAGSAAALVRRAGSSCGRARERPQRSAVMSGVQREEVQLKAAVVEDAVFDEVATIVLG